MRATFDIAELVTWGPNTTERDHLGAPQDHGDKEALPPRRDVELCLPLDKRGSRTPFPLPSI